MPSSVGTRFALAEITLVGSSQIMQLAALELRRYWYARTGQSVGERGGEGHSIVLCTVENCADEMLAAEATALGAESAVIRTRAEGESSVLTIVGADEVGLLYGAYRVCERWGVYFHLHGDTLPDQALEAWPEMNEDHQPIFSTRGLHPFHNFPEGPDSWDTETYRLHLAQMAKMGMNFIGFHAYTPSDRRFEPQVWVGLPDAVGAGGTVKAAYAAETWHPRCGSWNYHAIEDLSVLPLEMERLVPDGAFIDFADAAGAAELFRRIGERWADVFAFAKRRGVRTCLGLEIPLHLPESVCAQLRERGIDTDSEDAIRQVFTGIFTRIAQTHPMDLFWLYVPEDWVWLQSVPQESLNQVVRSVEIAQSALQASGARFGLGVASWTIGPLNDPLALERLLPAGIPLAALSAKVGHLPISPYYNQVTRREGWAIPWLEDDPRLTVPQLWAGRTLRDAADAHALGCEGLLGIHWRTRCLAPQMAAMARSSWDQSRWNSEFGMRFTDEELADSMAGEGQIGGEQRAWPKASVTLDTTVPQALFHTVTYGAPYYNVQVPAGKYRVRCFLVETDRSIMAGGRRMSIYINGEPVMDKCDIVGQYGHDSVVDLMTGELELAEDGILEVYLRQVIGETILSAIEVEGQTAGFNQFEGVAYRRRINCGGPLIEDATGDWEAGKMMTGRMQERPRAFDSSVFYQEWATAEFGPSVGPKAAEIFARIDGKLPCITYMWAGPGNCTADETPWERVSQDYTFVGDFSALSSLEMGAGERDRFDYWYHHFAAFRAAAHLRCCASTPENTEALEAAWRALYTHLLEAVRSPGDLGTLFSIEQQWRMDNLKAVAVDMSESFEGSARIVMTAPPANIESGASFSLQAQVVGAEPPATLQLQYRAIESQEWETIEMPKSGIAHYTLNLPASQLPEVFVYRVQGDLGGRNACYPAGALVDGLTCVVECNI
jgi:hypothetical protein